MGSQKKEDDTPYLGMTRKGRVCGPQAVRGRTNFSGWAEAWALPTVSDRKFSTLNPAHTTTANKIVQFARKVTQLTSGNGE